MAAVEEGEERVVAGADALQQLQLTNRHDLVQQTHVVEPGDRAIAGDHMNE